VPPLCELDEETPRAVPANIHDEFAHLRGSFLHALDDQLRQHEYSIVQAIDRRGCSTCRRFDGCRGVADELLRAARTPPPKVDLGLRQLAHPQVQMVKSGAPFEDWPASTTETTPAAGFAKRTVTPASRAAEDKPTSKPSSQKLGSKGEAGMKLKFSVGDKKAKIDARTDSSHSQGLKWEIERRAVECAYWWVTLEEPEREGRIARLVTGTFFESAVSMTILVNAIFMLFTTDYYIQNIGAEPTPFMNVAEGLFLAFFFIELLLRLCVHRLHFFCNMEMGWNIFDFVLVAVAIYDAVISTIVSASDDSSLTFVRTLRALKVAKSLRLLRILHCVQELRLMLQSVLGSFLSLFWSLFMLACIFYMFSMAFVQVVANFLVENASSLDGDKYQEYMYHFGSVFRSMLTCFKAAMGGDDWSTYFSLLEVTGTAGSCLFLFFIVFMQIALLNILTGIFVERAMKLARPESEDLAIEQRMQEMRDKEDLYKLFGETGQVITAQGFLDTLRDESTLARLSVLGLDIRDPSLFFARVQSMAGSAGSRGEVDVDLLVDFCLKWKGVATSLDYQSVAFEAEAIGRRVEVLESRMQTVLTKSARDWAECRAISEPPVVVKESSTTVFGDPSPFAALRPPAAVMGAANAPTVSSVGCRSGTRTPSPMAEHQAIAALPRALATPPPGAPTAGTPPMPRDLPLPSLRTPKSRVVPPYPPPLTGCRVGAYSPAWPAPASAPPKLVAEPPAYSGRLAPRHLDAPPLPVFRGRSPASREASPQ